MPYVSLFCFFVMFKHCFHAFSNFFHVFRICLGFRRFSASSRLFTLSGSGSPGFPSPRKKASQSSLALARASQNSPLEIADIYICSGLPLNVENAFMIALRNSHEENQFERCADESATWAVRRIDSKFLALFLKEVPWSLFLLEIWRCYLVSAKIANEPKKI